MKALTCMEHGKFALIEAGKIDTTPLIIHRYELADIEEAFRKWQRDGSWIRC